MNIQFQGQYNMQGPYEEMQAALKAMKRDAKSKNIPFVALTHQLGIQQEGSMNFPDEFYGNVVGPLDRVSFNDDYMQKIGLVKKDDGHWYFPNDARPITGFYQMLRIFTCDDALKFFKHRKEYNQLREKNEKTFSKLKRYWSDIQDEMNANGQPKTITELGIEYEFYKIKNRLFVDWGKLENFVRDFVKFGFTYNLPLDSERVVKSFGTGKAVEFEKDGIINNPQLISF